MEISDDEKVSEISKDQIFFGNIPLKQYFDPLQKFRTDMPSDEILDQNNYINLAAILDTGSTKSMIGYDLVPQKYHKLIGYNLETKTVENRIIKITHYVEALGIQFLDFADNFSFKYELPQILINPKEIKSQDFLLGLNFITSLWLINC